MRPPNVTTSITGDATNDTEQPITVTVAVAQKISGLGTTTIWARISDGTLASVSVGRRRLIRYDSLLRLLTPTSGVKSTPSLPVRGRPRKSGKVGAP